MTGLPNKRWIGAPIPRRDGPAKVTGTAPYAFEQPVSNPLYLHLVQATIARGQVTVIDTTAAEALDGVVLVMTQENAPRLASDTDQELWVLQSVEVAFRGQVIAAVLAEHPEIAHHAAGLIRVGYQQQPHDVDLRADRDDLYPPEILMGGGHPDTTHGDVEAALMSAAVTLDATYTTPMEHHNPMEPHTTVAIWTDEGLTLYESTQAPFRIRAAVASSFGLDERRVRVVCPHVGGGFGSKAFPHASVILAAMAAHCARGRPVKLALTRQQMFSLASYRTPTIQRVQLGADASGRLIAIAHDVVEQTARIKEFAEPTAVATRMMYAASNRRTTHRLAALDLPVPSIMRAPGECPGMFGLEVAMDEMAIACGMDPIEFRIRTEPDVDPESGLPFTSRNLAVCLREGAHRFDWKGRDPTPRARQDHGWLIGTGVASSTYPVFRMPGSTAKIRVSADGRYTVAIAAVDIGTGTWTALAQIAADALQVSLEDVELQIGDSALPRASQAGAASGITSWGSAIVDAALTLLTRLERDHGGQVPQEGLEVIGATPDNPYAEFYAMHSFGAQFAEVRVHEDTGEVRVPRLLGIFAAGRVINAKTGHSQLLGGMTMGLSMALHENSVLDPRFGHPARHQLRPIRGGQIQPQRLALAARSISDGQGAEARGGLGERVSAERLAHRLIHLIAARSDSGADGREAVVG